jgi:hypothetical protein
VEQFVEPMRANNVEKAGRELFQWVDIEYFIFTDELDQKILIQHTK